MSEVQSLYGGTVNRRVEGELGTHKLDLGDGYLIPLVARAASFADRVALQDESGTLRYRELLTCSERAAARLAR